MWKFLCPIDRGTESIAYSQEGWRKNTPENVMN